MLTENNNSNNVYETVCDGKYLNYAIGELRASVVPHAVSGRRYRITVVLLPEVTVEDCLRKAVGSGKLVPQGDGTYRWVECMTIGMKALWVERVAELTGMKKKWRWAELYFGDKNLKQELCKAKKNNVAITFVKGILPRMDSL